MPELADSAVAVFGPTGFIGKAVVEALLTRGETVRALVRDPTKVGQRPRLTVIQGDVADAGRVRSVVEGTAAVVSCLGTRRGDAQPADFLATALASIIDAMRAYKITREAPFISS